MLLPVLTIGTAATALGGIVVAGWLLRLRPLVQPLSDGSAMTLSTAAGFMLGGATLMALARPGAGRPAAVFAALLAVLSAAVLVEHAAGIDLGIDLHRLHAWLDDGNPEPGRSSVHSVLAFLAFAAGALLLHSRRILAGGAAALLGVAVLALGALNLAGYALRLEDLFPALQRYRMAPHTSAGMALLGAGLLVIIGRRRADAQVGAERRIVASAIVVLSAAVLVAGAAVFELMRQRIEESASAGLQGAFEVRRKLVLSLLEMREGNVELVAAQPELRRALRQGGSPAAFTAAARDAVHDLIGGEFLGVVVQDAFGREVVRDGELAERASRTMQLAAGSNSELRWQERLVLRTRVEVRDGPRVLGSVILDQRMPILDGLMRGDDSMGQTGEMALCFARGARMLCYPQRLNPVAFEIARESRPGRPLPMAYGLDGGTGVIRTRDYRGQNVIAAYGPVGETGLGMVLKVDTAELYAPLRARLGVLALVLVLVIATGAVVVRSRVRPVAARLAEAESAARESRDRLQKIADNVPALVGYVDAEERYQFVNRTYDLWFGQPHEAILGKQVREVWDETRYAQSAPYVRRALAGERVEFQRVLSAEGGGRTLRTTYVPDVGADGRVAGLFILSSDITEQAEARRALDHVLQRLEIALEAARVTVWEADIRSGEVVLSDAWAEVLGRTAGETRTTVAELAALVHPEELGLLNRLSMEAIRGQRSEYAVEHRVRAESGEWKWILSRGRVVERDPASGRALRMVGTNLDITGRKRDELRLEQLANYDELTGAAHRNLFGDRLAQAILRCRRGGSSAALLYLDIDKFKGVNDTLGHAAGDALLKEFAARIKACVRATDTVGRLGGDEFAVLLESVAREGAERVAGKILEAMRAPVPLEGREVTITTSIGIATFGGEAEAESLARAADAALYEAKSAGRNCFRVST